MRKVTSIVFSFMTILMLAACGSNVDEATSEKYITQGEEVVSLLNDLNYEEVHAMFDDHMATELPGDQMEDLTPVIEGSGDFETIEKSSVEEKDGLYVVVIAAAYSNEDRMFTITFNNDDDIAGLYIK